MISKILIAVDGTESGNRALDFGLDLAEKYSASVTILNILDAPMYATSTDSIILLADTALLVKDLRKVHESILARALERATNINPNVQVKADLKEGNPSDQIVLTSAEGGFDIIVVGKGDESKARKLFLGSTSQHVANAAQIPVLIVK